MNATKTNNKGAAFEDILNTMIKDAEKKIHMLQAVEQAKEEMQEELKGMGDMVMGSVEVEECPCSRKCGAVKISAEFIAMTFTPIGVEVKKGTIENILTFE